MGAMFDKDAEAFAQLLDPKSPCRERRHHK